MLQDCERVAPFVASHAAPELAAATVTVYADDCVPPPQLALQLPQAPQLPTQSAGQPCVLQDCVRVAPFAVGHVVPPFEAASVTVYVDDCVPPPHVTLQLPHAPQLPSQFTLGVPTKANELAFSQTLESKVEVAPFAMPILKW